jgi:hypothetical protein
MKRMRAVPFLVGITCMGTRVPAGTPQSVSAAGSCSTTATLPFSGTMHVPRYLTYTPPAEKAKTLNYFFDEFRRDHGADAAILKVTARHGADAHRRLSFPAIIAPYAGATTAIYGWYPSRYGAKDSLRMGNYAFLAAAAGNVDRPGFP